MISIRRCGPGDIGRLMAFIDCHWQKRHLLATNRSLMDWQHRASDGSYDYLLALRDEEIVGALGYIASRRFDPALSDRNVIWLALWKIRDGLGIAGLGLRLLDAIGKEGPQIAIAVNGINSTLLPLYRSLKYRVAELRQYFVTNPASRHRLLTLPNGYPPPVPCGGGATLVEMTAIDLLAMNPIGLSSASVPEKTPAYFANRFLRHPIYRYRVFLLSAPGTGIALLATRTAEYDSVRALRIVDFAGDPAALSGLGTDLAALMRDECAEYADFWQLGLPEELLAAAGFEPVAPDGPVIVPNYFEPFLARNGRIQCAIRTRQASPVRIFRADGDQDRPNRLP